MSELRELAARIGFRAPSTLAQSGNLLLTTPRNTDPISLETQLETAISEELGRDVTVMVRYRTTLADVVANNPFTDTAERDPSRYSVYFAKSAVDETTLERFHKTLGEQAITAARSTHIYSLPPEALEYRAFTHDRFETLLGVTLTERNWNTVCKLVSLLGA